MKKMIVKEKIVQKVRGKAVKEIVEVLLHLQKEMNQSVNLRKALNLKI